MASAIKKVEKFRQTFQLMKRWKSMGITRRSNRSVTSQTDSDSDSDTTASPRRIPSGFFAVYVGSERRRFVIPTRFLNLPIFVSLLKKSEEEFGYQSNGGLVLACEEGFFKRVLNVLEKDEQRFRKMEMDEFLNMFAEVGFDSSASAVPSCKDELGFTPLLQKSRVRV